MDNNILPLTQIQKHMKAIQKIVEEHNIKREGFLEFIDGKNSSNFYYGKYTKYDTDNTEQ